MLYTITTIIFVLVLLNFILLKFSCNSTKSNYKKNKKPVIFSKGITSLPETEELAPTGS